MDKNKTRNITSGTLGISDTLETPDISGTSGILKTPSPSSTSDTPNTPSISSTSNIPSTPNTPNPAEASPNTDKAVNTNNAVRFFTVNPHIFREYDIRGHAERDLTDETVILIGWAFGCFLKEKVQAGARRNNTPPGAGGTACNIPPAGGTDAEAVDTATPAAAVPAEIEVLIGADNRLSSPRLKEAVARGLAAAGCRVVDLGTIITPMLYYAVHHFHCPRGVMITGSHNPPQENGFKLLAGNGTIYGRDIQRLKEAILSLSIDKAAALIERARKLKPEEVFARRADIVTPYLTMLKEKITLARPLKVVVDCGNGTASYFAVEFLTSLGCRVLPLYCEPDGSFPHHQPDPVKRENLRDLVRAVVEYGADVGLAFDGDADRIGAVDNRGRVIWGDQLMALFWREILPRYPKAVAIIEVKCSQGLVDEVMRLGGRPYFYRTGHSLIKAKMRELNAVFTGEMSGHMFFADEYYGYDDAFYAAGRLLRLIAAWTTGETDQADGAVNPKVDKTAGTKAAQGTGAGAGADSAADGSEGSNIAAGTQAGTGVGRVAGVNATNSAENTGTANGQRRYESFADLIDTLPVYYSTAETRIPCRDEDKFAVVERLVEYFRRRYEVIDVDGARVLFGDGWGLIRASNTQPVLVARCEGRTPEALNRITALIGEALKAQPEVGEFEWEY